MTRTLALLFASSLAAAALATPPLEVEIKVTGVEVDDAKPPVIVEVEVTIANHSESRIKSCTVDLSFLGADGKSVMLRKHELGSLDLAPGADTLTSFQDTNPPKTWNRTIDAVARCHP